MDNRHIPPDRGQTDARHGEEDIERGPEDVTRSARIDRDVVRHPRFGAGRLHQIIGHPSHTAARLSRRSHEEAAAPFGTELRRTGRPIPSRRLLDGCARDHELPAATSTKKLGSTHGGLPPRTDRWDHRDPRPADRGHRRRPRGCQSGASASTMSSYPPSSLTVKSGLNEKSTLRATFVTFIL